MPTHKNQERIYNNIPVNFFHQKIQTNKSHGINGRKILITRDLRKRRRDVSNIKIYLFCKR
jgi:hypothetical protein